MTIPNKPADLDPMSDDLLELPAAPDPAVIPDPHARLAQRRAGLRKYGRDVSRAIDKLKHELEELEGELYLTFTANKPEKGQNPEPGKLYFTTTTSDTKGRKAEFEQLLRKHHPQVGKLRARIKLLEYKHDEAEERSSDIAFFQRERQVEAAHLYHAATEKLLALFPHLQAELEAKPTK